MPVQRLHLANTDHGLECNFVDLSKLNSNKRKRTENRNSSMGNMVKTMSVIHTHRKPSKPKDTSSNRPKKSSRLTLHAIPRSRKATSPSVDSSTVYDPSTSPTYYHSSSTVRAKKPRNCSPLPAWLASTFSSLVRNHPLRLLLPGNPSPPQSPSPALHLPPSPSLPPTVYRAPNTPPPRVSPKHRHGTRKLPSPRHASQSRNKRSKEDKIFAFDPFEATGKEPEKSLGYAYEADVPRIQQHIERPIHYNRKGSPEVWVQPGEQHRAGRQLRDDNYTRIQLEASRAAPDGSPDGYELRELVAPPAPTTPAASLSIARPLDDQDEDPGRDSPLACHSLLSAPGCSSIDEPGLPSSQYVGQLYKTRGPASTIEVSAPCPKRIYFESPTNDTLSCPSFTIGVCEPVFRLEDSDRASPLVAPTDGSFFRQPFITPIAKPSIPVGTLNFSWEKFDLNGIQAPSASKKPIYRLPLADGDSDTEISSVLPSLLPEDRNLNRRTQLLVNEPGKGRVPSSPYEASAPASDSSKATYAPGPSRLVRGSQTSNKSKSERVLKKPTRVMSPGRHGSPTFAFARPNTPVSRPKNAIPARTLLGRLPAPMGGSHAPPPTPARPGDALVKGTTGQIAEIGDKPGVKYAAPASPQGMGGTVTKTPKSSAVFAPAPGIYISPLRGSDTSKGEKLEDAELDCSQESNDSIRSWSDRF